MTIPSAEDVMESVTVERFQLRNWKKHRDDELYPPGGYPFFASYAEYNGQRFTRRIVFEHFAQSAAKGVISAIKWGYPNGGRPGGIWRPFSAAFRSTGYVDAINELRVTPAPSAFAIVSRLNRIVPGVGTATTTKIAYFARLKSSDGPGSVEIECLIYDSMVRRAIAHRHDPDFVDLRSELIHLLRDISPAAQEATYGLYLQSVHAAALRHRVRSDQIELFLFRFGRGLPPRR